MKQVRFYAKVRKGVWCDEMDVDDDRERSDRGSDMMLISAAGRRMVRAIKMAPAVRQSAIHGNGNGRCVRVASSQPASQLHKWLTALTAGQWWAVGNSNQSRDTHDASWDGDKTMWGRSGAHY